MNGTFSAWVAIGDRADLANWLRHQALQGNGFLSAMRRALYREGYLTEQQEHAVRAAKVRADRVRARSEEWRPPGPPARRVNRHEARA